MKLYYFLIILLFLNNTSIKAQVDRSVEPTPDIPKEINLGDLKSIELENGLKVFLVPKPGYGKFAFSLSINQIDINNDPQPELRNILSKLYYNKSSLKYSQEYIDSTIDFHGAKMGVTINGGFVIGLKEHIHKLMSVYSDLLINPNITREIMDEIISEEVKQANEPKKDKSLKKDEVSFNTILIDSLLNRREEKQAENSSPLNYKNITLKQLNDFQRERVVSNNSTAILIGDFTEYSARKLLNKYFAEWQKGLETQKEEKIIKDPVFIPRRTIYVIDNPQAVQSKVGFHWNLEDAFQYFDDEIPLLVMNRILGGYANSYIYRNLREDKGLCYYALSSISPTGSGGTGFINTSVRTEKTHIAVENIIFEMLRIRNTEVSEKTLRMAKNSLIGDYARSIGGVALQRFLSFAMTKDEFNLPDDYLKTYPSKIGEITSKDIVRMAQKYVKPNNCIIIVEGKAEALKGILEPYGEVKYFTKEGKLMNN